MTQDDEIIQQALEILSSRLSRVAIFSSSVDAKNYARLELGGRKSEVFAVMFLDAQNRLIEFREMFYGTIDSASVYPREIVRAALELNAAAVILVHNHPSGIAEPSRSDILLTERVSTILQIIDTRVIDHLVVSASEAISLAERGLI